MDTPWARRAISRDVEDAVPFGPKCGWLAIRGALPADFEAVLGVTRVADCGWEQGIAKAYEWSGRSGYGEHLFVTPDVEGWTLVVGTRLFVYADPGVEAPFHDLVVRLSKAVGSEVHYFATHRVSEAHCWAMAVQGALVRAVSIADGAAAVDLGDRTDEEPDPFDATEQDVFDLAGTWSVDPSELAGQFPRGQLYTLRRPEVAEPPRKSAGGRRWWWPFSRPG